jgi:voltage-gated potassium channel
MENLYVRKLKNGSRNNIILRTAWSACLWDMRRIAIAKTIADALNRHFENDVEKTCSLDLKEKKSGY